MSDSVGSVSVEVVPDARGWSEKLRAQLRDQKVQVKADADVSAAETKLDEVARDRTAKVRVNVDKNPLDQGAKSLDGFIGKLGMLPALAIAGGAALVPLAGALGGVAAALAAPLAIAGGGATLFAVLAGFAVKDTEKQAKAISTLQTKLNGLTKGTAEYKSVQKQLMDSQKALGPGQLKFLSAKQGLGSTFENFIGGKAGVALLGPLTQGMTLLSHLLPSLTPVIVAASGAFSTLLGDISKAASGPGFDKFIRLVSGQVGHDLVGFGRAAGQIAKGLGALFVQLDKSVGSSMVDALVRLSTSFSNWSTSRRGQQQLQSFLDYFHKVGPQVADTVGSLARGIGHLVAALAPLGPPALHVIKGIADAVAGIPAPVLTALLAGTAGTIAFQKVGGFKAAPKALALGQNALSALTGGLVPGVNGGGVVPVRVVNWQDGGLGGGGSKSTLGKVGGFLEKHPVIAGTLGTTAAATGVVGGIYAIGKLNHWASDAGKASQQSPNSVGGMTPQQWREYNAARLNANTGLGPGTVPTGIKSTATALDALRARAGGASRAIDQIGPHAAATSGVAVHALHGVLAAIEAIHPTKFQVIAQTAGAIASLERLQAMRIADKSFNIYAHYNASEQAVGPGGGMGQNPHGSGGGGASGGMSGRTAVHVHLDDSGRAAFTGYLDQHYQDNSGADAMFQRMRAGH